MALPENFEIFRKCCPDTDFSFVIKKSKLGGRGLFATKLIKKGTLIFENNPLAVGPRGDWKMNVFCAYCYGSNLNNVCQKCLVLLCPNCESFKRHIQDCSFITQNWKLKATDESNILTKMLMYVHCLTLDNEREILLNLLQQDAVEDLLKFEDLDALCEIYDIPEKHISLIKRVHNIFNVNAYRISQDPSSKVPLRGLFPLSSFLNHSCVPNTRNIFKSDYSMAVYATKDIDIGEEIVSCYTSILWCTPARRVQLYKAKHFWCKCHRCSDPTELGTKLSALKCLHNPCTGILLPVSPLDPKTQWICDECNSSTTSEKIGTVQSILGSLVGALDIEKCLETENAVIKRLEMFVPNFSHILVDLRLRLLLKLGHNGQALHGTENNSLSMFNPLTSKVLKVILKALKW